MKIYTIVAVLGFLFVVTITCPIFHNAINPAWIILYAIWVIGIGAIIRINE